MLYQGILVVAFFLLIVGHAGAAGTIGLPFGPGQTWTVCRGYNVIDTKHEATPVLDLTIGQNSVGNTGCIGDPWASAGKQLIAPGKGKVYHFSSQAGANDGICLDLDDGGALGILHFGQRSVDSGSSVSKGQTLGTLAGPTWLNGPYAHLHIQAHETNCQGALRPFTETYGFRFEYHDNLPCDTFKEGKCTGSPNQHSGVKLSNPAASTWHPPGTLIRAVDDYKVYFLQGGKRQWVYDETTFNAAKFLWEDVIVVSPQERDCYQDGPTLYPQTFNFPSWNNYRFGTLVRQTGTDPVYVIGEDKMLHHLNITEAQFISFGYNASMIRDVSSVGNIGASFTYSSFQQCQKNLPPQPTCTYTYTLSPTSAYFKGVGGEGTITVNTQTGCSWNVQYRPSWFEVQAGSSGKGPGTLSYRVLENPSFAVSRSDIVAIAGEQFRIDQDNQIAGSAPAATGVCVTSLSPMAKTFTGLGGFVDVSVNAPSSCSWNVHVPENWIHASLASGTGSRTLRLTVDKNESFASSRGNVVTIGGAFSFRIDQDNQTGSPPSPSPEPSSTPPPSDCVSSLSPAAKNFSGNGGSVTVNVHAPSNCSWSVSIPESWIHTSPSSGTGSGTLTLTVDQNPSTATSRGNNVTIGGVKFRVDQDNRIP